MTQNIVPQISEYAIFPSTYGTLITKQISINTKELEFVFSGPIRYKPE